MKIALKSVDNAGGPHIGGGSVAFKINGQLVVVLGDQVTPHDPINTPHWDGPPVMVEGCQRFKINGKPVCTEGHLASCGHPSSGSVSFNITGDGQKPA